MLKMLTGLAAKVFRMGKAEDALPDVGLDGGVRKARAAFTDSEMLDWLDRQIGCQGCKSGLVAFRWSTTGRGWRLMEVSDDYPRTLRVVTNPSRTVRKAISDAMLMVSPTDAQSLDWLDEQTGSYTGTVIWRLSTRGLGWRLHETSWDGAKATVRETISDAMRRETTVMETISDAMRREAVVNARRGAAIERLGHPDHGKGDPRVATPSHMYCITQAGPETFECAVMAQDGYERWEEASLDAAVESVIRGAKAINHVFIGCDNITIQLKDPVNAALCRKCGDIIISRHRHDFVECECGAIAVDGGKDYSRRVGDQHAVGEVPTNALFDVLLALPPKDREKERVRLGWRR